MHVLRIEHSIADFDSWKEAFDRDPARRQQSGVRRFRILHPVDDPNYVMIDLDFASLNEAETFLAALREVWQSAQKAPALIGIPRTRIVEVVEDRER